VQCADRGSTERDGWPISVQCVDRGSAARDGEPISVRCVERGLRGGMGGEP
jgi:hypothetical protein